MRKKIICALVLLIIAIVGIIIIKKTFEKKEIHPVFEKFDIVKSEMSDCEGLTYDNLKIDTDIDICNIETLYEFDEISSNEITLEEVKEKAIKQFSQIVQTDLSEEYFDCSEYKIEGYVDENGKDIMTKEVALSMPEELNTEGWMGLYDDAGNMDITTMEALQIRKNTKNKTQCIYINREYDEALSFNVSGEKYSIKDSVSFAKSYVDNLKIWDERLSLEPYAVVVFDTKGPDDTNILKDNYFYLVLFNYFLDGVELSRTGPIPSGQGLYPKNYFFSILIDKKDHVGCIKNLGFSLCGKEKEINQKFVTLKSCLDILSDYLAGESNYTVTGIDIVYTSIKEVNSIGKVKPYWRVILSERAGSYMQPIVTRAAYVDMSTGDIYIYDDVQNKMLGEKKWE